jgi:ElaB/YqjD/DUF883 family membrane-anchored ribosome-binding protein
MMTKPGQEAEMDKVISCVQLIYAELANVIDGLVECDSANTDKYETEGECIESQFDELLKSANKYLNETRKKEPASTAAAMAKPADPIKEVSRQDFGRHATNSNVCQY